MVAALSLPRNEDGIAAAIGVLKQRFGERLQTGAAVREQHGHTTSWIENQPPDAVVTPASAEEVAEIVRVCATHRAPVIAFGTGTSLEGHTNAPAGGVCVDLMAMNAVLAVHAEDLDAVVQPGVTRKALNAHLRDTGLFFPIDPGADASLGGMAATRASGTNAVRYGTMRDNVIALQAVTPDGRLIRTASRARKTSAGYDLTRLMIGAEGTLGIITELTLRLYGIPEAISTASCSFADIHGACAAVIATIQMGVPVARIELLDPIAVTAANAHSGLDLPVVPLLLLEFHGTTASVAEQAATFGEIAADCGGTGFHWTDRAEDRNRLWQARHDMYWAIRSLRPRAGIVNTDVCVPISRLADCVTETRTRADALGFPATILGHVGDGNFHVGMMIDQHSAEEIRAARDFVSWLNELAISMDGTCTGEHGVGQGKIAYLRRELGEAVDVMRAIKAALDPLGIMNPGKVLPD